MGFQSRRVGNDIVLCEIPGPAQLIQLNKLQTMSDEKSIEKVNQSLLRVLSKENGYFGRVFTWGHGANDYEYIGYELTKDFYPVLEDMSSKEIDSLVKIINYFQIHAAPLKEMLPLERSSELPDIFAPTAWSHFMIIIMFGMLEVVAKQSEHKILKDNGYMHKFKSVKAFLRDNLPTDVKKEIVKDYKTPDGSQLDSFDDILWHLWQDLRSGFVHEAEIKSLGLEWTEIEGMGTENEPLEFNKNIPMQEWMRYTWLAILRNYGYEGRIELPEIQYGA